MRRASSTPTAPSAPAANSSESPGRNGVTTNPVSAKITQEEDGVDERSVLGGQFAEVTIQVKNQVEQRIHAPSILWDAPPVVR